MSSPDKLQRSVLPIPHQPYVGLTTYDAKDPDTKFPPIQELRPPEGAPNVLIVLLDDVGFVSGHKVWDQLFAGMRESLYRFPFRFTSLPLHKLMQPAKNLIRNPLAIITSNSKFKT